MKNLEESTAAALRTLEIGSEQYRQGAIDETAVFLITATLTAQQDQLAEAPFMWPGLRLVTAERDG